MHIPLHRFLVTFGALWLFLTVLWVGLQSVIVVFPDHTHLLSTYFLHSSSIFLILIQQKSGIRVIRGVGVIMQFLEHKLCGILTRTVWSVVVGHVVLAIHIVNSLETNRVGPISRQILVLSEHNLFTSKGKGT